MSSCKKLLTPGTRNKVNKSSLAFVVARHVTSSYCDPPIRDLDQELNPAGSTKTEDDANDDLRNVSDQPIISKKLDTIMAELEMLKDKLLNNTGSVPLCDMISVPKLQLQEVIQTEPVVISSTRCHCHPLLRTKGAMITDAARVPSGLYA